MTEREALKLALEALEGQCRLVSQTRHRLVGPAITAIKEALSSCQCQECKVVLHASDCAVHSEPAYPKGQCNCGAQPAVTESHKQEQLMSDQINYGMSVTQGGKRIDPMSIYKEPEHDKTDVRCECCGYMTYHREHLGCIRAAKLKEPEQDPLTDEDLELLKRALRFYEGCPDGQYDELVVELIHDRLARRSDIKPLTDEEIILIVADCASSHQHTDIHFARAIEAKLKEKNTHD